MALRSGEVLIPRLVKADGGGQPAPPDALWRLDTREPGSLEHLEMLPVPEAEGDLGPHEVRVAVRAAGVNFRDVVVALGLVERDTNTGIGFEGSGIVLEVGSEVVGLTPGERVLGMFDGAFGTIARSEEHTSELQSCFD